MTLPPIGFWQTPPQDFRFVLRPGEVHVWLAPIEVGSFLSRLRASLSFDEVERAARFRSPADRRSAIISRGVLRELLGNYLRTAPSDVAFTCNEFGKPGLACSTTDSQLSFNVSHSHECIVLAFAQGRRVGIDVERIRPEAAGADIANHYLAPGEVDRLAAFPGPERVSAFFECWTRKEAFLKARGDGLMGRLDTFEVSFGRDVAPAILRAEDDHGTTAKDWTVVNLPAGDDYAGALVVEGPCEGLKCFRWSLRHEPFAAPYSVRKLAS